MAIDVKICGLNTPDAVAAAVEGGAKYVGFVFYPPSPRMVTPAKAGELALAVPKPVIKVGLVVNPDDRSLQEVVAGGFLDMLQLHGRETPERVLEVNARFGLPVIKCVFIEKPEDVTAASAYEDVADMLLLDALAPKGAAAPGGNALVFEWNLISGRTWKKPWLLAGGLNVGNLETAIAVCRAKAVDVSSGVEISRGVKSPQKIREFLELAQKLSE